MTTESKIKQLDDILNARKPFINRWDRVRVGLYGYFPEVYNNPGYKPNTNMVYIVWDMPKNANIHPIEIVEFPISKIDEVIVKKLNRLNNEVKKYKS